VLAGRKQKKAGPKGRLKEGINLRGGIRVELI